MRKLQLTAFAVVCLANAIDLTAQTTPNRESVRTVMEQTFSAADADLGFELAHLPGTWSVAIAQFAKGDSRVIEIPAKVSVTYQVVGGSESWDTDVDICVYGPDALEIACRHL